MPPSSPYFGTRISIRSFSASINPCDGAAVFRLDHRIARGGEHIPSAYHVRRTEKHHRIPVGVALRHLIKNHAFIVVELETFVAKADGRSLPGLVLQSVHCVQARHDRCPGKQLQSRGILLLFPRKPLRRVWQRSARRVKLGVSSSVVRVGIGVPKKHDRQFRHLPDRGDHVVSVLRKPGVHDDHILLAHLHRNVAARASQHVHIPAHGQHVNAVGVEIRRLDDGISRFRYSRRRQKNRGCHCQCPSQRIRYAKPVPLHLPFSDDSLGSGGGTGMVASFF